MSKQITISEPVINEIEHGCAQIIGGVADISGQISGVIGDSQIENIKRQISQIQVVTERIRTRIISGDSGKGGIGSKIGGIASSALLVVAVMGGSSGRVDAASVVPQVGSTVVVNRAVNGVVEVADLDVVNVGSVDAVVLGQEVRTVLVSNEVPVVGVRGVVVAPDVMASVVHTVDDVAVPQVVDVLRSVAVYDRVRDVVAAMLPVERVLLSGVTVAEQVATTVRPSVLPESCSPCRGLSHVAS
jgi:hypothetical protein